MLLGCRVEIQRERERERADGGRNGAGMHNFINQGMNKKKKSHSLTVYKLLSHNKYRV